MSTTSDAESDFNLELHFLPAWAKESPKANRYENFQGAPERRGDYRDDRRGGPRGERRDRPPRRDGGPPPNRGPGPGGDRRGPRPQGQGQGQGQGPGRGRDGGPRGPRGDRDGRGGRGNDRDRGRFQTERPAAPPPLPEIQVAFVPDDHGVDLLTRQIRMTGRAYPLFEIAQMILAKPERHSVTFSVKKSPEGALAQPLFICAIDETLWLSEEAARHHVLSRHFALFYQAERTKIDPPKGTYTFVAQCGMSQVVLGPPNHHDYQNHLRKLHGERFGRMPFEAFKARVRIVKDPEVVKQWIEDQSWKTEYLCLNLPEALKLGSRAEVEKHFRETHLANIVKPVETHRLSGPASRNQRDRELLRVIRVRWEEQRRFPMQVATSLSQQFAARGLQFFKVNRTVTHVAVARPSYLDLETTPVSDGVRRIVEYINSHPKCTHKQLLDSLAPAPPPPPAPAVIPVVPSGETTAPATGTDTPAEPAAAAAAEPSPELAAVMMDLHWLVQQGNVIEFANGVLETARKPSPRPPKPEAKPAAAVGAVEAAAAATPALPGENAPDEGEVSGPAEPLATATDAIAPVDASSGVSEGSSPEPVPAGDPAPLPAEEQVPSPS